jgi:hypothetical protein
VKGTIDPITAEAEPGALRTGDNSIPVATSGSTRIKVHCWASSMELKAAPTAQNIALYSR